MLLFSGSVQEGRFFDLANDSLREVVDQLILIAIAFFCLTQESNRLRGKEEHCYLDLGLSDWILEIKKIR